jgi:hypothetical protein
VAVAVELQCQWWWSGGCVEVAVAWGFRLSGGGGGNRVAVVVEWQLSGGRVAAVAKLVANAVARAAV